MKKWLYIILVLAVTVSAVFLYRRVNQNKNSQTVVNLPLVISNPPVAIQAPADMNNNVSNKNQNSTPAPTVDASGFLPPLDRAGERVTKKTFGLFVTPQNSPVQPERFTGFHTGADFEIFPEELNSAVTVHAVCPGKLLAKEYATGYGGVVVEACTLNGQAITVIYGHLRLASINTPVGSQLAAGDVLGVLGAAYSSETNGERKHLHLGFHKGTSVNILGYVQNKADLAGWLDPCSYVCHD